jgi:hypothetical protein
MKVPSSGMWRCVVQFTSIWEEYIASVFRAKQVTSKKQSAVLVACSPNFLLFYPEEGGVTLTEAWVN